ncbi:MAG: hypothetical protein HC843_04435 [Sphingomonadales bacterium]|nr:hypothetical protein [Sphingomonadales bacterium]
MTDSLSFHPEEQSLGAIGDALFLDIRHRIMTAHFGPGQFFYGSIMASEKGIDAKLMASVARALQCHGYVTDLGSGKYSVKGWSQAEFNKVLLQMRDSQRSILVKFAEHMSDIDRLRLAACLDVEIKSDPLPIDVEAYYIRWLMFFQCSLHAYGMGSFRTFALTLTPPYLRRRLLTGLAPDLIKMTFSGLRRLFDAYNLNASDKIVSLVDEYCERIFPILISTNDLYNEFGSFSEVDYRMLAISGKPLFRKPGDNRPDIALGFREPLSWEQFRALGFSVKC